DCQLREAVQLESTPAEVLEQSVVHLAGDSCPLRKPLLVQAVERRLHFPHAKAVQAHQEKRKPAQTSQSKPVCLVKGGVDRKVPRSTCSVPDPIVIARDDPEPIAFRRQVCINRLTEPVVVVPLLIEAIQPVAETH